MIIGKHDPPPCIKAATSMAMSPWRVEGRAEGREEGRDEGRKE